MSWFMHLRELKLPQLQFSISLHSSLLVMWYIAASWIRESRGKPSERELRKPEI